MVSLTYRLLRDITRFGNFNFKKKIITYIRASFAFFSKGLFDSDSELPLASNLAGSSQTRPVPGERPVPGDQLYAVVPTLEPTPKQVSGIIFSSLK